MRSHVYQLSLRDLARLLGPTLAVVAGVAGALHVCHGLGLFPPPRPTLDVDRTILVHQIEAARRGPDAAVLLLGDSSCLMDVDAAALSQTLQQPVLNLGTLSYLDLSAYAKLLKLYATHHPNSLRQVVLLVHPEALRRPSADPYHTVVFMSLIEQRDPPPPADRRWNPAWWMGLERFQSRIWARFIPTPLPGAFGRFYGFSRELEAFMDAHMGSAIEPSQRAFEGSAEYRLAPTWQSACRRFRASMPPGVRLFVGITPVPEGFALKHYPQTWHRMLDTLATWLQADKALDMLPAVLPDAQFATLTHLNATGAQDYTARLAEALRSKSAAAHSSDLSR